MSLTSGQLKAFDSMDKCTKGVQSRVNQINDMVGTLYPSILMEEIEQLRNRKLELWDTLKGKTYVDRRTA